MSQKSHENEEYQNFLISDSRENLIPSAIYDQIIPEIKPDTNLLDFGCGLGFVLFYYAQKFQHVENTHFYGCDYQEDLLDLCWKKITQKELKNTTPFFTPDKSRLHFPEWLPKMNHIVLSFSLSCAEEKNQVLLSLSQILAEDGLIHILEWEKDYENILLDNFYSNKNRFSFEECQTILEENNFTVIKKKIPKESCYCLTVSPPN